MKIIKRLSVLFLLLSVFFFHIPHPVYAKLFINEFSSGTATDWIEIYNDSNNDIPLSSYSFRDGSSSNKLELNGILAPKGFIVFEWSDRLNNGGDTIKIVKTELESEVEDQITYGNVDGKMVEAPPSDQYAARTTDGGGSLALYTSATKGFTNVNATPAPTATSAPTETPKPTQTPTKAPTPTKTPTLGVVATTATTAVTPVDAGVLGATVKKLSPTPDYNVPTAVLAPGSQENTTSTSVTTISKPKVRTLGIAAVNPAIIMMGVGTLFLLSCFGYGYHLYKKGQL